MKVGIYESVEVSDEQRALIAADLGQKTATRDDLKTWIWQKGARWESALLGDEQPDEEPDEDLLGGGDEDLLGTDKAPEDTDEDLI